MDAWIEQHKCDCNDAQFIIMIVNKPIYLLKYPPIKLTGQKIIVDICAYDKYQRYMRINIDYVSNKRMICDRLSFPIKIYVLCDHLLWIGITFGNTSYAITPYTFDRRLD